jgi:hypothetical protein
MGAYRRGNNQDKPKELYSTSRSQKNDATGRFERDPGTVPKGDPSTLAPPPGLSRAEHIALRKPVTDARHVRQGRAVAAEEKKQEVREATNRAAMPVFSNAPTEPNAHVLAASQRPALAPVPSAYFSSNPDAAAVMPARVPNPRTHSMLPSFITPPSAQPAQSSYTPPSVKPAAPVFLTPSMPVSHQFRGSKK